MKANPEAALPFMALGAIINANNAGLPEDLDVTLNCRYVYRPPFDPPDVERKFGNLTLTYAAQVHVAVVEVDPETGVYEIVDYAAVDDCGKRINPQVVEGQVMGATAQALGAATHETFTYDEDGNLLTPNFYDYHVPHALDMPPLKTGNIESPSPFTSLGTKGMGEGGGAGIHAVCAALQDALSSRGKPIVYDSCNPYHRVWELLSDPESSRQACQRGGAMKVEGERAFDAPREAVWHVLNDPAAMAAMMPGVESFDVQDEHHWRANVKIPLGLGALGMTHEHGEDRGARAGVRAARDQGQRRRRDPEHEHRLQPQRGRRRDEDGLGGRRAHRRPGRLDGPARAPADRQPAGSARPRRARRAGEEGPRRAGRRGIASAPPGDTCPLLARDHTAPRATPALAKAASLGRGRVRPLA